MSESRWGKVRDNIDFALLVTLFAVLFCTTASTQRRLAEMEERLLDRLDQMDQQLMDTIHRQEHAGVDRYRDPTRAAPHPTRGPRVG